MTTGILFNVDEETAKELKEDAARYSPFHDDINEGQEDIPPADLELLTEREVDEETGEPVNYAEAGDSILAKPRRVLIRKHTGGQQMAKRMSLMSGHQTAYPWSPKVDFVDENRLVQKEEKSKKSKEENDAADRDNYVWPDAWKDAPEKSWVQLKPVSSKLRAMADFIGADPVFMRFPAHMRDYTGKKLINLLKSCKKPLQVVYKGKKKKDVVNSTAVRTTERWNYEVALRQPTLRTLMVGAQVPIGGTLLKELPDGRKVYWQLIGCPRVVSPDGLKASFQQPTQENLTGIGEEFRVWIEKHTTSLAAKLKNPRSVAMFQPEVYRRPGSDLQISLRGLHSADSTRDTIGTSKPLSHEFVRKVEAGETIMVIDRIKKFLVDENGNKTRAVFREPLITKCALTGQSLVHREGGEFRSWQVAPNLWGMSIGAARKIVDASAVVAGLTPGNVKGKNIPEKIHQFASAQLSSLSRELNGLVDANERCQKIMEREEELIEKEKLKPQDRTALGDLMVQALSDLGEFIDIDGEPLTWWDEQEGVVRVEAEWKWNERAEEIGRMVSGADPWAIMAIATSNPRWSNLGKKLIEFRDRFAYKYSDDKIAANQKELRAIARRYKDFL